ncbi:AI-2E family transporter [Patescibacteria group bacterium]|nr:AI-2E family transporter [Patescibacteria group bacterium]MCG2702405.1 AI-2E family transporter [Candidatus Parcubacteria bacterium]MBU4264544.1 AI-2E family transporter [Patescibacteria group bacterium]MBU4390475.1 AI-2E family transporter [Patescibacteria group bacterium]MBU4397391.1 AI-2E family transporter [Patescibacteria group bacterium]
MKKEEKQVHKIEISHKTIIFAVIFLGSLLLVWKIRELLVLFFICFILMESLNPTVERLEKFKIPRGVAIVFLYIIMLTFLSFGIAGVIPVLIEQTTGLINSFPRLIEEINFFGLSAMDISSQLKILENLPANITKATLSVFSNLFSGFLVLMITFYLLVERKKFKKYSLDLFGKKGSQKTMKIMEHLEKRLGSWVNAELILMLAVGLLSYVGYLILGLQFAVPLAILAGILELVPNIGPTVATIVAMIIGFSMSPVLGLLSLVWGITVQQIENNFIVPKVMKTAVGLNPLVTIFLLAIGAKLAGISGAVLAIPAYLTTETLIKVFWKEKK